MISEASIPKISQYRGRRYIDLGGMSFGRDFTVIAGPCSVESQEQIMKIAEFLSGLGIKVLRGGAYKPRTSPYSFQGFGEDALRWMRRAADEYGMITVSEVMSSAKLDKVSRYVDIIQIGSRNSQNFDLLKEVGKQDKPVILKRGFGTTVEEWLYGAEYVMNEGNEKVILCERGIRTFEGSTRFTLDISAVPVAKEVSSLPVIVDPSHAAGRRSLVTPLSRAAQAVGADGIMVEMHPDPDSALSDGKQSLSFPEFIDLLASLGMGRRKSVVP